MSTADRVHLARENLDLISVALGRALSAGADVDDIVVVLMDTRDHLARELTQAILDASSDLNLEAEEARVLGRGEIPTGLAVVPLRAAELLFTGTHPSVTAGLGRVPPEGCTRVVVVGAGGATLMHLPVGAVALSGSS